MHVKSSRILVPFPDSFPRFAPFFGRRVLSGKDVKLTIITADYD